VSYETIENAIRTRFGTQVEDAESVMVQYDNVGDFSPPGSSVYVRLSIQHETSRQVETGGVNNRRFRLPGLITASVFGLPNVGTKSVIELADSIAAAFRGVSDSGITYRSPTVTKVGRQSVEDRYQIDVDVPFYSDVIA